MVILAVFLPSLLAFCALILDAGMIFSERSNLQHATDAAAIAAAVDIRMQHDLATAATTAQNAVSFDNSVVGAEVMVHSPPLQGPFAGRPNFVEVTSSRSHRTFLIGVMGGRREQNINVRSVAGVATHSTGAAIVVLDPSPADISLPSTRELLERVLTPELASLAAQQTGVDDLLLNIPVVGALLATLMRSDLTGELTSKMGELVDSITQNILPAVLPSLPTLIAGLEVEGIGTLKVDGAVHVNNQWGSQDEHGDPVGMSHGPPYGVACFPALTTRLAAKQLRVVGGVDRSENYIPFDSGERSPLTAGRIAVPDPLEDLPVPSVSIDPNLPSQHAVHFTLSAASAASVVNGLLQKLSFLLKPIFGAHQVAVTQELQTEVLVPGVYESLTVIAPVGGVKLMPGIYVIRGRNPITKISLCMIGPIEADGVLFYIGDPALDGPSSEPPPPTVSELLPSTLIASLVPGAKLTGLKSPGNPLNEMLIFQDRNDRRPILLEAQHLIGSTKLQGTIYAKWGHVSFVGGQGIYDFKTVSGSARFVTVGNTVIAPSELLKPSQDVVLVD